MLLIDGVKYELWTPKKEVEEFHPLVKEHYKEIFGNNSIFFEGSILKSESGKSSVPDGFVVTLGEMPQWHIVEMELSTHQLYDHIVNQVGRFINGVKNTATQKKIIEAVYQHIQETKQRKAEFEEAIGSGEIFKFISDLITKLPVLVVIIENRTQELDEALDLLRYSPIKIVEFQTFKRVGAEAVHAHLFEPLYKPHSLTLPTEPQSITQEVSTQRMGLRVWRSYTEYGYIGIWKKFRDLFPAVGETIELVNGDGEIFQVEVGDYEGSKQLWGLQEWYRKHPDVKEGDSIIITVIEPMKKYHLEIVK
jgi:hypothetical protein